MRKMLYTCYLEVEKRPKTFRAARGGKVGAGKSTMIAVQTGATYSRDLRLSFLGNQGKDAAT